MTLHFRIISTDDTEDTDYTQASMKYPAAKRSALVETLHGVQVPDPYRWLEDADSPESRAWVDAQNALTRAGLDEPSRDVLVQKLTAAYDCRRTTSLVRRGCRVFFTSNPGLLNQAILYVHEGGDSEPRVLVDPNTLAPDGTTALTAFFPSEDGRFVAYAISADGSDRQEVRVIEVCAGTSREAAAEHGDTLSWVKFASVAWAPDASGFFYLRFPATGEVAPEDEQYFGRIYFHRLGNPQSTDARVFETPERKDIVPLVAVSRTGRWVVITAQRGASDESEVYIAEVDRVSGGAGSWKRIFSGFEAAYQFIEETRGRLFFRTTAGAPKGRIISIDPEHPEQGIQEVVAESADRLSLTAIARDSIVASFLHAASDRIRAFDLDERGSVCAVRELHLPAIGSLVTLDATPVDDEIGAVWTSFTDPPRILTFAADGRDAAHEAETGPYETRQVWYASKDGTRVSMFVVHRRDLPAHAGRRTLLSGYGGFNISRTPVYDPGNLPWLDAGGIFAVAHIRGGGEYGEDWHHAGMLEKKQSVFDDFIAAAEFLIAEGYTIPGRLAIEGGSNGGLLVAAVMLQRPDLFGAVVCRVPVADMLRYHLFTVGRFWIPEYGSADDPSQFEYLLRYSPYHNIRTGVLYPPALVMTADTDDRVSPGMAKKFAARLQAEADGGPFLIRIETKAGHGLGKPVTKLIDEDADILAFLDRYLG
ncbi:MAG TPA: prolyl oligopeptidase family serine peptidase [Vicinamibacterales bacterium]